MKKLKYGFLAFAAFLMVAPVSFSVVKADSVPTVNSASTNISADSVSGASVALPAITVTEAAAGNIHAGLLTWTLPSGFVFDTTSLANATYTGTGLAGNAAVAFPTNTTMSLNISAVSTAAGSLSIGTTTPIKVKAAAGTPLASGNLTLTGGTIDGITSTTIFASLVEVAGAPTALSFSVQPPATIATGANFGATVAVRDQFANTVTSDNGRSVTLSDVLSSNNSTAGTGTLGGTLAVNDVSGLAAFSGLTYSAVESIDLKADSSGLTSVFSTPIDVTAQSGNNGGTQNPPSSSCGFDNGSLIKIDSSPTVYMVVNCSLRPFQSEAIFHARGKKFEDVQDVSESSLPVGSPVGESEDDNVSAPSNSGTTSDSNSASLSGQTSTLPQGALVKVPGDPTVYMVNNGALQPFDSLTVFKARGENFGDVQSVSQQQIQSMGVSSTPVPFPDNTLVQGSGSTIFVIKNGQKLGIPSMSVLQQHGWSLKNVLKVDDHELEGIQSQGVED